MTPSPARLAFFALLLSGCGQPAALEESPSQAAPKRSAPPPSRPELGRLPSPPPGTGDGLHTDFRRAFQDGLRINRADESLQIRVHQGGRMEVGSGVLLVGDPGYVSSLVELPLGLPKGSYPVQLSRVQALAHSGETVEQVAAMRLLLGERPAVRWLYLASVHVDTGSAALLTPTAAEVLKTQKAQTTERLRRRMQGEEVADPPDSIDLRLQQGFGQDLMGAVLLQSHLPRGPVNFAACSSGFGDGSYDVYVGLDDGGIPAEIVIDFRVLLDPIVDEVLIPDMDVLPPGPIALGPLEGHGIRAWKGGPYDPWLLLDASTIFADARFNGVEIQVQDPHGQRLHPDSTMQGGIHRLAPPGVAHARLHLRLQVGVRPL